MRKLKNDTTEQFEEELKHERKKEIRDVLLHVVKYQDKEYVCINVSYFWYKEKRVSGLTKKECVVTVKKPTFLLARQGELVYIKKDEIQEDLGHVKYFNYEFKLKGKKDGK